MFLKNGKIRIFNFIWITSISFLIGIVPTFSGSTFYKLLGDFNDGWAKHWQEKTFNIASPNRFQVVQEDNNLVLKVESNNSASGIWRKLKFVKITSGKISWRWKVKRSLVENNKEMKKKGDDYAARVFVVFEPHLLPWKTRTICYVWAGNEPVGTIYKSPYSGSVATIVLQSGDEHAGQWINEKRDFVADYLKFFGKKPKKVSAFAVMVDTDNTDSKTTAWFDDMLLELM